MQEAISKCLQTPNPNVEERPSQNVQAACTTIKQEVDHIAAEEYVLEINVPACVNKIVITKNGKKVTFEL